MHLNVLPKAIIKLILICPYNLVLDLLQIYSALKKSFTSHKSDFLQMTKEKEVSSHRIFK